MHLPNEPMTTDVSCKLPYLHESFTAEHDARFCSRDDRRGSLQAREVLPHPPQQSSMADSLTCTAMRQVSSLTGALLTNSSIVSGIESGSDLMMVRWGALSSCCLHTSDPQGPSPQRPVGLRSSSQYTMKSITCHLFDLVRYSLSSMHKHAR